MDFPQKIKMKVARPQSTLKTPMNSVHVSTLSPMRPIPVFVRNSIPSEHLEVAINPNVTLDSLQVPTYGELKMHLHYFQVPIRTVCPQFNDYINDTTHTCPSGEHIIPSELPYFMPDDYYTALSDGDYSVVVNQGDAYDFYYSSRYFKLTTKGQHAWSLMRSLGYNIPPFIKRHYNAVRLLAWAKVYSDWYYNSQYADVAQDIFRVRSIFAKDGVNAYHLDQVDLRAIFGMTEFVNYQADLFTSVWDKPFSPNQTASSSFQFVDYQSPEDTKVDYAPTDWVPLMKAKTDDNNEIHFSQYMIDSLKALTDYLKRNQMSGTYSIDRYLSRFGVILAADKLQRSRFCGQDYYPITINKVTSTAHTDVSELGDFGGNGGMSETSEPKVFESDEFCVDIVVASIVPTHIYVQGCDRMNMILDKSEWYLPEFDNLGVDAVSTSELIVSSLNNEFNGKDVNGLDVDSQVFGYAPRYYYFKLIHDSISGLFSIPSVERGLRSWYFGRFIDDDSHLSSVVHSPNFCMGYDGSQYDRMFNSEDTDHFTCFFVRSVSGRLNCESLFDTYQFDSKGEQIVIDTNGVKHN